MPITNLNNLTYHYTCGLAQSKPALLPLASHQPQENVIGAVDCKGRD
jgi:hypothetical protein